MISKISCTSTSLAEMQKLQYGLDAISEWMNTWKLELALPKYSVMRIGKSKIPPHYSVYIPWISIYYHSLYLLGYLSTN